MEIVGVSANVRYQGLKEPFVPVVFIPYDQGDWPPIEEMTFALRTTGDPLSFVRAVRDIIHRTDVRVPLTNVKTQVGEIEETINQEIVFAKLCTGFAFLALVIASVGLDGTTSYGVVRRTSEIGIRMALGARREKVVLMVLREVLVLAALGLAIGASAGAGHLARRRVVPVRIEADRSSSDGGLDRYPRARRPGRRLRAGAASLTDRAHHRAAARVRRGYAEGRPSPPCGGAHAGRSRIRSCSLAAHSVACDQRPGIIRSTTSWDSPAISRSRSRR